MVQAALTKDVSSKAAQQITGVGARRVRQIKKDAELSEYMFNTDGPATTEDEDNPKSGSTLLDNIIENMYVAYMVSITAMG